MATRIIIYLLLLITVDLQAQTMLDTTFFDSPVKHEILLAGSFGELRTTHFHAGIDIKPTKFNTEGDSIFVAGPGYISRIKIQTGGYGRVLYIDHPNGYTSVYAHMQVFQDSIESYIEKMQLASQSYEIDIYPQSDKFVIPRGAFLGYLGNTGRSYGAHLHFEIRNTNSETPINPLLFGIGPKDTRAPDVPSVSVHGLSPDLQEIHKSHYPTKKISKNEYTINNGSVSIPAWRVGVLLQGWDRMDGASNKNGIYRIEMLVDDTLQYGVTVDSISWDETAYIKTHVDYAERQENKRTSVRCYSMPGNRLNIYDHTNHDGIIPIYESTPRNIKIKASDFEGQQSTIQFGITRNNNMTHKSQTFEKLLKYNQKASFKIGRSHISVPINALDRDLYFNYSEENIDGRIVYNIHKDEVPLYKPLSIQIPIEKLDSFYLDYLCAVLIEEDGSLMSKEGIISNDSLTFTTKTFGNYKLHIDTIAPTITPIQTSLSKDLTFIIKDDISDVSINAFIDGKWIIAPFKILNHTLTIPKKYFSSGEKSLSIIAVDQIGNRSEHLQVLF